MANRTPSLMALLGLLAVAGYQHRDKIADALKGMQTNSGASGVGGAQAGGLGGILGGLGDLIGGKSNGGNVLTGGLNDLLDNFRGSGQAETASSWTTVGVPTKGLSAQEVESAIGKDTLTELAATTRIPYDELLTRLSTSIPQAVDKLTPDGKFPQSDAEARESLFKTT
ncbi:YidB family protein [Devosia sp.]|uniref:YidB family protein n=1 Tax=Devosia sp. TaxID=1871048 RepID=UPI001AC9A78B|nr:YidB family protein [Devosia sp.]MBN9335330.1 DUF937 domain-containing protein [Devosia sp.]